MIALAPILKYAPVIAGVAIASSAHDDPVFSWFSEPTHTAFVLIGIALGILFRVGYMVDNEQETASIKRDVLVSILIGGANTVIAIYLVVTFRMDQIQALVAGVIIAATGVQAGVMGIKMIWRRIVQAHIDDVMGQRRQDAQKMKSAAHEALRDIDQADGRDQ